MNIGSTKGDSRHLTEERYDRLHDLSPSAKFVFIVLRSNGTLDQDEIAERTLLPKRTVRYALDKLERADLVEVKPGVHDARTRRYSVLPTDQSDRS